VRRAPPETLAKLGEARLSLLAAGTVLYGAGFFLRGARLNFLLPPGEPLPVARAASLSAATLFLVQVLPFRGGELASWALYRIALGAGWVRSGAVFAVVKIVDSGVLVLAGLSGAALLAVAGRALGIGAAAAAGAAAGAAGLLLAPRLAGRGADRLSGRFPEGSRRRRLAAEIGTALRVAHEQPRRYLAAIAAAASCLAVQLGPSGSCSALFTSRRHLESWRWRSSHRPSLRPRFRRPRGTSGPQSQASPPLFY